MKPKVAYVLVASICLIDRIFQESLDAVYSDWGLRTDIFRHFPTEEHLRLEEPPLPIIPGSRAALMSSMALRSSFHVSPSPLCTSDLLSQKPCLISSGAPVMIVFLYQISTRGWYLAIGSGDDVGEARGEGEGAVEIERLNFSLGRLLLRP